MSLSDDCQIFPVEHDAVLQRLPCEAVDVVNLVDLIQGILCQRGHLFHGGILELGFLDFHLDIWGVPQMRSVRMS